MKISGFSFVKNATRLYFPVKESIASVLPLVDEFVVALGIGDEDDRTEAEILSLKSDKIRIIRRQWDESLFKGGAIYRHETNFALSQCSGDWCFYIQADEVMHEKYLDVVRKACRKYLDRPEVDGFLFGYRHFWGDYDHVVDFHGWYDQEIRIIRNRRGIESIVDAQSFSHQDGSKLKVVRIPARIYHYGWVRPPRLMRTKKKEQDGQYWGKKKAEEVYSRREDIFDYGALGRIPKFIGTHPAVMQDWIARHDWKEQLNYSRHAELQRPLFKHEKKKYRRLTWLEKNFFGGRRIFGYSNWKIVAREKAA